MFDIKNLKKHYSLRGRSVEALKNFTYTFPDRGMVFILGRSGCGKSTLLHLLAGIDRPTSGSIFYNGQDIAHMSESDLCRYRRETVGLIFQQKNLFADLSVRRNLLFACGETDACSATAERLGLKGMLFRNVGELSGGQAQRVAIGRTLLQESKIILADEPTGNLDEKTSKEILGLLREVAEQKLVIVVTHDRESAERYADTIIRMRSGEIAEIKQILREQRQAREPEGDAGRKQAHLRPFPYVGKICFTAIWDGRRKWQSVLAVLLAALAAVLFGMMLLYRTADPAESLGSFLQQNSELYPRFEIDFTDAQNVTNLQDAVSVLDENGAEYMLYNADYYANMTQEKMEKYGFTSVTKLAPLTKDSFYIDLDNWNYTTRSSCEFYFYDPDDLDLYMQANIWIQTLETVELYDCVIIDGEELPIDRCGKDITELVGYQFKFYTQFLPDLATSFEVYNIVNLDGLTYGPYLDILEGFAGTEGLAKAKAQVPVLTLAGVVNQLPLRERGVVFTSSDTRHYLGAEIVVSPDFPYPTQQSDYKALIDTTSVDFTRLLQESGIDLKTVDSSGDIPVILIEQGNIYGSYRYYTDFYSQLSDSAFNEGYERYPTGIVGCLLDEYSKKENATSLLGVIAIFAAVIFILLTFQIAHSGFRARKEDFALMRALGVPRTKIVLYSFAAIGIFLVIALVLCLLTVFIIYSGTHILRVPNENATIIQLFQEVEIYIVGKPMTSWRSVEILFLSPGLILGCIAFAVVCALPMFVTAVRSGIRGKIADNLRREL